MPRYLRDVLSTIFAYLAFALPVIFGIIYTQRKKQFWFIILPPFVFIFAYYLHSIFNNRNFFVSFFNNEGFGFYALFVFYFMWSSICLTVTFILVIIINFIKRKKEFKNEA